MITIRNASTDCVGIACMNAGNTLFIFIVVDFNWCTCIFNVLKFVRCIRICRFIIWSVFRWTMNTVYFIINTFSSSTSGMLTRQKDFTVQARNVLTRPVQYNAGHFCWPIHFTHAFCYCLYTIFGLAPNVLK